MTKSIYSTTPPPPNRLSSAEIRQRIADGKKVPVFPGMSRDDELLARAQNKKLNTGLPFLYGWKWYTWARQFYESTNRMNLLCAANQISKSSTQIRKCINWATDQKAWPDLWARAPVQFWYLYPTQKQVNAEFETKWKLFLPTNEYKDDPYYGYKVEKYKGDIIAIHFHSGVHVYFKTYMQNAMSLQSGTCDAMFCDEELPEDLIGELIFRLAATNGYWHMVFTATLGQEVWRKTMEPEHGETEGYPDAFKQTVSLYDAMTYEDGSPSQWTLERIKQIENTCPTASDVLKRVYGKFIVIGGRIYESFDIKRHFKPKHPLNKTWQVYSAVDLGSGGDGHPPAIIFLAAKPDYRAGRFFLGWLGDDGRNYTDGDVFEKHESLKKEHNLNLVNSAYDWGSKDFHTIAERNGVNFQKAEKSHEIGEGTLNTLFKNDMLFIYEDVELRKLGAQLASLKHSTLKRNAKDDFADAARYCANLVPWDWTAITGKALQHEEKPEEPMNHMQRQIKERRDALVDVDKREQARIEDEFNEWNEAYGNQ